MGQLHKKIERLEVAIAELVSVLQNLPVGHSHKFEGQPDCNDDGEGHNRIPICVVNCPACARDKALAKYGVS